MKVGLLERGVQALLLDEVLALGDALGTSLLKAIPRLKVEEVDPGVVAHERLEAVLGSTDGILPSNVGKFFPISRAFEAHQGAVLPERLIAASAVAVRRKHADWKRWLSEAVRQVGMSNDRVRDLEVRPTMIATDVGMMEAPRPSKWSYTSPLISTKIKGHVMNRPEPLLVFDPKTLKVTVLTQPTVVCSPLMVLILREPVLNYHDGDIEWAESLVIRAAAFLSSSWAQNWMRAVGRVWFSPDSEPHRDVPVPAQLWVPSEKDEGEDGELVEKLGRKLLEQPRGDQRRAKLGRDLDLVVKRLVAPLKPLEARAEA